MKLKVYLLHAYYSLFWWVIVDLYFAVVAPPVVMVSRLTEGQVKLSSTQTLKCEVRIIEEVDVPIITGVQWIPPPLFHNESKLTASNTTYNDTMFSSFLTINDYSFGDSGNYSCMASAIPTANVSGVKYKTVYTVELTHVYTSKLFSSFCTTYFENFSLS